MISPLGFVCYEGELCSCFLLLLLLAGGMIYSGGKSALNSEPEAGPGPGVGRARGKLSHFLQEENLTIVNYAKSAF